MTDADVQKVIDTAARRGITVSAYDASVFLGAQDILKDENAQKRLREPAQEVVNNFNAWMRGNDKPWRHSFAEFILPVESILTDEEKAAEKQSAERFLAAQGKAG